MTRVAELQKKYPSIPLEVIVKWEFLRNGIRDTEDLAKASHWMPTGATHYSYQTYDFDVTLNELAAKWPAWVKPGYMLRPTRMYMKNGIGTSVRIDTRSPYEFRDMGDGKLALFEGEERIPVDMYFPHPKPRQGPDPRTSKGNSIFKLLSSDRRCFRISPVRYCQYFDTGEECRFCNFNGTQKDAASVGVDRGVTINLDETVEAFKILGSEVRLLEGQLEAGAFVNREAESSMFSAFVEKLASANSYHPNLSLHVQPLGRADLLRLKDSGLDVIAFHIEVMDRKLFEEICPGKARGLAFDGWLEAYQEAVDVFGFGCVHSCNVGGVTMLSPNGHKTWQEARDFLIEGNTWLIKNGVQPSLLPLRVPPGSDYWEDPENQKRRPPTEFYLETALAYDKAYVEADLYEKVNRFMMCGFECFTYGYGGEIGILSQYGDMGNWMAKCTPPDGNWLAQFISSVKENRGAK